MAFYDELRETIEEVDGINRAMARGLVADLKREFGTGKLWDAKQIGAIQQVVDARLVETYGPSRGGVVRGKLYQAIYRRVLFVGDQSSNRFWRDINTRLNRHDRARWSRVKAAILSTDDPLAGAFMSLGGRVPHAEQRRRARLFDPQRRWVSPGGHRLSDRVWDVRIKQRQRINKILRNGIRSGESPVTIANKLERYLNPDHAAVTYRRDGRIVRKKLGTGGEGAYSARRLARTELSAVNHKATVDATKRLSKRVPGTGLTWRLSPAHKHMDHCNFNAANNSQGFPRGTYTVEEFPRLPDHANCLCVSAPYTPSSAEVLDYLERAYIQ